MKKLLVLITVLISIAASAQPNYTYSASRMRWIAAVLDSTFHIPAGPTASIRTGGFTRSGALFYDSVGADSGLYVRGTGAVFQRYARASEIIAANANVGSGFRLVKPSSQEVKTLFGSNTIGLDSSSNTNGITLKADTSVLATQYDLTQNYKTFGVAGKDDVFNEARYIDANGQDFIVNGGNEFFWDIQGTYLGSAFYSYIDMVRNFLEFQHQWGTGTAAVSLNPATTGTGSHVYLRARNASLNPSELYVWADSFAFKPWRGIIHIDTLAEASNMTNKTVMVFDSVRKRWERIIEDSVGGSGGTTDVSIMQFRITTESGVPVSTSDRTGQGTIYMTPYSGNQISLYGGASWVTYSTAQISLALSGLTSGKNYDVFAYNNLGTITLELSTAWTDDNTRADALTRQDGVLVKSGATTRRYIGTIRTTGTATTEDSGGGSTSQTGGKRFVWNYYNRVPRSMSVFDGTDSWGYTTDTWRQANGASGNQVEYVTGDVSVLVEAQLTSGTYLVANTASSAKVGIGISSTSSPSGFRTQNYNTLNPTGFWFAISASYKGTPGLGYFYISWLEKGAAGTTCNFNGDGGGDGTLSGLNVTITN
jgi:hypothetical protein